MTKHAPRAIEFALLCSLAGALTLSASQCDAQSQVLPAELTACATMPNDVERLACYDQAMTRLKRNAEHRDDASQLNRAPPAESAAKAENEFGMRADLRRKLRGDAAVEEVSAIKATVKSIGSGRRGEAIFTLTNGQVWSQVEVGDALALAVGDEVTIKRGALGSFLMVTPARRSAKVRRER